MALGVCLSPSEKNRFFFASRFNNENPFIFIADFSDLWYIYFVKY